MQIIATLIMIIGIYFLGNEVSQVIEPIIVIPGNLIGMGILYILLTFKIIKIEFIEKTGDYLLKHMSFFFIPFGVSIISYYDLIKADILTLLVIVVVSTVASMWITAKVIDIFVKRRHI